MSTASETSTAGPARAANPAGDASQASAAGSTRTFRGRSVAELIPTIQAELGPEAIVVGRRSGLEGGIGGFFQRPFVEIEAQAASPTGAQAAGLTGAQAASFTGAQTASPTGAKAASLTGAQAASPAGTQVDLYDGVEALPEPATPSNFDALSFQTVPTPAPPVSAPQTDTSPINAPQTDTYMLSAPQLSAYHTDASQIESDAAADRDAAFADVLAAANSEPITITRTAREEEALSKYDVSSRSLVEQQETAISGPSTLSGPSTPSAPSTPSGLSTHSWPSTSSGPSTLSAPSTPSGPLSRTVLAVMRELQASGFDEAFALELIDAAGAHVLPFAPRIGLRRAVRTALARRIPTTTPLPHAGAALALVGPGGSGKTRSVAGLAASYRRSGTLTVGCASISGEAGAEPLQMVFSPHITAPVQARSPRALKAIAAARAGGLVLIDTPPVSPAEGAAIKELARLLGELSLDSTVIALPATLGAKSATQLLEALRPLKARSVAITHADETDQLGVTVQAACDFGLAPEYLLTGARTGARTSELTGARTGARTGTRSMRSITRLDPTTLAERLLP